MCETGVSKSYDVIIVVPNPEQFGRALDGFN
jgi:hypothetical protein